MVSTPAKPTAPPYGSPAAYTAPQQSQYPSVQSLASLFPQATYPNAYQLANQTQQADTALGKNLSLYQNPLVNQIATSGMSGPDTSGAQSYSQQFYNANIAPGIAQTRDNVYASGMSNSSAGGAELGTMEAQGQAQATLQGQGYYTNALNNLLNARSNLFGTSGQLATNAAAGQLSATQSNQQVGSQLANAAMQTPNLQNQYQLASTGAQNAYGLDTTQMANAFDLSNYQQNSTNWQTQANNAAAQNRSLTSGGKSAGAMGVGAAMGGGLGASAANLFSNLGTSSLASQSNNPGQYLP